MERQPYKTPPKWWSPIVSPFWMRVWRPIRRMVQYKSQRIMDVEIRGLKNLKKAADQNAGVMITPNHSGHCDPILVYRAAEAINNPFYFMCAWQVFNKANHFRRLMFRTHGCFSVDREGTDMRAFRRAMEILQTKPNPLVLFPEGEVYHLNDRITPFKDGAAAIALTATKRSERPILIVPCAIKYIYTSDPTPELVELMTDPRGIVRHHAGNALHKLGPVDEKVVHQFLRLAKQQDAEKRALGIEALGRLNSRSLP